MSLTRPDHGLTHSPRLSDGQRAAGGWVLGMVVAVVLAVLPWWPAPAVALAAAVALAGGGMVLHGLRRSGLGRFAPCNRVTLGRLGLTAVLAGMLALPDITPALGWLALGLALAALMLDGLDGWLARRGRDSSAFGARFDMEVDAALIAVLALLAWSLDKAGLWVLALGMMRYGFVAAAWVWPWLAAPLPHSHRRRIICGVQVAVLAGLLAPLVVPPVSDWLAAGALVALAASFAVDVLWLWLRRPAA